MTHKGLAETVLLARQPIVDADMQLFAYELLYRPEAKNSDVLSGDLATRKVIANSLLNDLDTLVGDSFAFINMTRQTILELEDLGLPFDRVVFEILEDVAIDDELTLKIESLKDGGYRFAIDDFRLSGIHNDHIALSEIVKVDVLGLSDDEVKEHVDSLKSSKVILLAEKVETWSQYELCKSLGFKLFQGYFFAKPQIISGAEIPKIRTTILRLLERLQDSACTIDELRQLIDQDPGLTFSLFKFANSAAFSKGRVFKEISEIVVLMGIDRLRNLCAVLALSSMNDKPLVLTEAVLRRAYLCVLIAQRAKYENTGEFFTLGIFSMLDAYLDQPIEKVLNAFPVNQTIKDAILTPEGFMGKTLLLAEKLESIESEKFNRITQIHPEYFDLYQQAAISAREALQAFTPK